MGSNRRPGTRTSSTPRWRRGEWRAKEASDRSPSFKAEIAGFDALLRAWEGQHAAQGNPITAAEAEKRQSLSSRLQAGQTLSRSELTELNGILEKELADARETNADLAVIIALIILIGLVLAALALASRSS